MISIHPSTAHLISWIPDNSSEVLYLSPTALYPPEKAIRGGVPICWPWFANNKVGAKAHGFARDNKWTVLEKNEKNGFYSFQLQKIAFKKEKFIYPLRLTFIIEEDESLRMTLITENQSDTECTITQALHTYLLIGNIENVRISGLDNVEYYDKVTDSHDIQSGFLSFNGETDRIYKTGAPTTLIDPDLKRKIRISSDGCQSTVIWNPGVEKATKMNDMPNDDYKKMCCIEAANTHLDPITIPAFGKHAISQFISVQLLT